MAQFTPSKKTIKDFNDGEEYLNRIDVVQAETVNNLVEGLLYAQENGGSGGGGGETVDGTIMLTEGREGGKVLRENDYFLDVVDDIRLSRQDIMVLDSFFEEGNELAIHCYEVDTSQALIIDSEEQHNQLIINGTEIDRNQSLIIGDNIK